MILKKKIFFISLLSCLFGCSSNNVVYQTSYVNEMISPIKVVLLAGEDNALGYSYSFRLQDNDNKTNVTNKKYQTYQKGFDNIKVRYLNKANYEENDSENHYFENVKLGMGKLSSFDDGCFGPEVGIAESLNSFFANEMIYIIKFSASTPCSIIDDWNVYNGVYYKQMIEYYKEIINELSSYKGGVDVISFSFVQGESDAKNVDDSYKENINNIINSLRYEFKNKTLNGISYIDPLLLENYSGYYQMNQIKKEIAHQSKKNQIIDVIGASLSNQKDNTDRRHYDAISMIKLGNLIGEAIYTNYSVLKDYDEVAVIEKPNNENVFGNFMNFKSTEGWDLSSTNENGEITLFENHFDNELFFNNVFSDKIDVSISLTVDEIVNNEFYPKIGIKLINTNRNGFFFYLDAINENNNLTGLYFGYNTITKGIYDDNWTTISNIRLNSVDEYTNDNFIDISILRYEEKITLFYDEIKILELNNNEAKLGQSKTAVCISTFNTLIRVKNYDAKEIYDE